MLFLYFLCEFCSFDRDRDGQLNYQEFSALTNACGDPQVDEDTLALALLAQDVPVTPQGTLSREAFFKLIAINAQY
jgi:hypothetical protein